MSPWFKLATKIFSPCDDYKEIIEYFDQREIIEEKLSKYPFKDQEVIYWMKKKDNLRKKALELEKQRLLELEL
jgi:hypothetical protein